LETKPSQELRNHFGQLVWDCFLTSAFELYCVHADPHPGNYLFMKEGKLGMLDFGCVKHLSPDFIEKIQRLFAIILQEELDAKALFQINIDMGILKEDLPFETFCEQILPTLKNFAAWIAIPFQNDVYDFSTMQGISKEMLDPKGSNLVSGMHRDQLYFDRTFMGTLSLLTEIGGQVKMKNPYLCKG